MSGTETVQRAEAGGAVAKDRIMGKVAGSRPGSVKFRAELDLAELDDRRRPGARWSGRGVELSRSQLILKSKRMCYEGRLLLVAVHMIDDRPVPLFGQVKSCDYDGEGLYKTELSLLELPDEEPVRQWAKTQGASGVM